MLYYIYYGYIGGYTAYKLYEYWGIFRFTYTALSYTYSVVNGVYRLIIPARICLSDINDEENKEEYWDMCEL